MFHFNSSISFHAYLLLPISTLLYIDTDEKTIRFQGAYVKELISLTDYPSFDVDAVCELFLQWEQHKHDDIMGYRNNAYRYVYSLYK